MERKKLPKSVRFEVLKRDSFTCQYCGREAPDVILEIDHIIPVSKGGDDSIMNLVTSCRDCNRGKSNKMLSDDTAVKKQKKQADELQERREQLEMMMAWKSELLDQVEAEVDCIEELLNRFTSCSFTEAGRKSMRRNINRFGFSEVYASMEIAIDKYYYGSNDDVETVLNKVGGICYNRKKARVEDAEQDT